MSLVTSVTHLSLNIQTLFLYNCVVNGIGGAAAIALRGPIQVTYIEACQRDNNNNI